MAKVEIDYSQPAIMDAYRHGEDDGLQGRPYVNRFVSDVMRTAYLKGFRSGYTARINREARPNLQVVDCAS